MSANKSLKSALKNTTALIAAAFLLTLTFLQISCIVPNGYITIW